MINFDDYPILRERMADLKELSKDNSINETPCYLTESSIRAVDFDKVKTAYVNHLGLSEETATSVDALAYVASHLALIEFKNGEMKSEKRKVKDKIRDSLMILCDISGKTISDTRKNLDFILVYNQNKNPLPNQFKKGIIKNPPPEQA